MTGRGAARALVVAMTCAFVTGTAAHAKETPIPLARSEPWRVVGDSTACHISARFGTGDNMVDLRLSKDSFRVALDLAATGPNLGYTSGWLWFDYAFNTTEKTVRAPAQAVLLAGQAGFIGTINPNPLAQTTVDGRISDSKRETMAALWAKFDPDRITTLTLTPPGKTALRLELGPMKDPLRMLDQCVTKLVGQWGFAPEAMRSLARWPVPPNGARRYMLWSGAALAPANSGLRFAYLLDVDRTGKATRCRVIGNRFAATDPDRNCADLVKHTRFAPALDAQGKPVAAYYITRPKVQTYAY